VSSFAGPIVDVGSGGGTPGIPLAVSLPNREVTLLEAERRKTEFLRALDERAAEPASRLGPRRGAKYETLRVAVAKALAQPPVAAEWCLPLVEEGGGGLWVGPSADLEAVCRGAGEIAGELEESRPGSRDPEDRADAAGFPRGPVSRRSGRSPERQ
jgi:16S rRNA (guanine527-N7)-methyltransferase